MAFCGDADSEHATASRGSGILYRDLNPSNVMIDGRQARITDFDLVATGQTKSNSGIVGTPANVQSEIYALGLRFHRLWFSVHTKPAPAVRNRGFGPTGVDPTVLPLEASLSNPARLRFSGARFSWTDRFEAASRCCLSPSKHYRHSSQFHPLGLLEQLEVSC